MVNSIFIEIGEMWFCSKPKGRNSFVRVIVRNDLPDRVKDSLILCWSVNSVVQGTRIGGNTVGGSEVDGDN